MKKLYDEVYDKLLLSRHLEENISGLRLDVFSTLDQIAEHEDRTEELRNELVELSYCTGDLEESIEELEEALKELWDSMEDYRHDLTTLHYKLYNMNNRMREHEGCTKELSSELA
ncbi:hypothetical protein V2G26_012910 [Clonostachys chloroleuca]